MDWRLGNSERDNFGALFRMELCATKRFVILRIIPNRI